MVPGIRGTVAIQVDWYEVSRSTRGSISLVDPAGDSLEAITPDLPIEEPDNSLSMGDEHLSTIPETESDELIKSSVEILVPIPSLEEVNDDHEEKEFDLEDILQIQDVNETLAIPQTYACSIGTRFLEAHVAASHWWIQLAYEKMAPKRSQQVNTRSQQHSPEQQPQPLTSQIPTPIMIDQGVSAALAARDATRNGVDSHTSGTGVRGSERVAREMETVFRISNCSVENQIKFSTCTLLAGALTWWNSHVMTVTHDVAYAMTGSDLRRR
ncbi:hypothetical protein Tco_0857293 [Tanacetum coccineum]|uniref:Reverse transcriptase domain-containing protein n=1 Tax=Tanacetum coccineum TaxID=301880 RepID=A0ABQ5B5T4_9ASTR